MVLFTNVLILTTCFSFGSTLYIIPNKCIYDWDDDCMKIHLYIQKRCANLWDDGCYNSKIPEAGKDDIYLKGKNNPGKRCSDGLDPNCNNNLPPFIQGYRISDQD